MGYLAPTNMLGLASSTAGMIASYPFSGWILANDTIIGQRFGTASTQFYHVGFVCGSAIQFTSATDTTSCPTMNFIHSSPEFCRVNWKTDGRCPEATVTAAPTRQPAPGDGGIQATATATGSGKPAITDTQATATQTMTAFPTRQAPVSPTGSPKSDASAAMTAYPTREVPSATATATVKLAAPSSYPTREMSAAPTWQAPTMDYSAPPTRPPADSSAYPTRQGPPPDSTPYPTREPCPDICVRRNVTGVPLAANYTAPIMEHSSTGAMEAPTSILKVMPGRYAMAGQQGYAYVGWVIIDDHYHGQKFVSADGEVLFVGFVCMPDMTAPGPVAMNVTDRSEQSSDSSAQPALPAADECGNRIMLMSPEFCDIDWFAGDVCRTEWSPRPSERPSMSAKPTEETRPSMPAEPSMSAKPTEETRPSMPAEPTQTTDDSTITQATMTVMRTAPFTPRPTIQPGESAPFTPRPTPRPTYSALPTRRPTLSSRPTLQFRTPRPEVVTKPIAAIASSIRIEVRNETLFDNPKNVEAVVKTIVCSLRVDYASVSVESIAHYRDGVFIRNITVPPKEPSRNMTGACGASAESSVSRRLQASTGIDSYTLNYAISNPPATVTALEPATVATLIETSPVLTTSLEMPANSYIAVSASEPALITASEPLAGPAAAPADSTSNILLGTLIPIGVLLVASVVATVVRRRGMGNPYAKGEPVISSMSPVVVVGAAAPAIDQTNPMGPQKQPSRRLVAPVKVRRIGS